MEYVSVLVGATFSDHPPCTDPTLAGLARLVNDASTDAGRPLLATFAPALAATGPTDARRTAVVVRAAVRAALTAAGDTAVLRRHLGRAERRYARVTGTGPLAALARRLDPLHRCGAGRRRLDVAVAALEPLPGPRRDAALRSVLAAAIAAALSAASTTRPPIDSPTGPEGVGASGSHREGDAAEPVGRQGSEPPPPGQS
jgi:hypothetical protein